MPTLQHADLDVDQADTGGCSRVGRRLSWEKHQRAMNVAILLAQQVHVPGGQVVSIARPDVGVLPSADQS